MAIFNLLCEDLELITVWYSYDLSKFIIWWQTRLIYYLDLYNSFVDATTIIVYYVWEYISATCGIEFTTLAPTT